MTNIRMDWNNLELTAEGHANAAKHGQDIVCAGISAVTQALLNTLMEAEEQGAVTADWDMDAASGLLRVRAIPRTTRGRFYAGAWYRMAVTGLQAIEENYPEYVQVKEE